MQPCSAHSALLPKLELRLDLTEKALKIHPWWKLFFSKKAGLEFIPCDFIKNELHHKYYTYFGKLSSWYHCYFFYTGGYNSIERTRTSQFRIRHLQLCNRQCLYLNADADAGITMRKFSNGHLSIYRGPLTFPNFQMAASKSPKIRPSLPAWGFFTIFTVVKILAKFGTTRKMLASLLWSCGGCSFLFLRIVWGFLWCLSIWACVKVSSLEVRVQSLQLFLLSY